MSEPLTLEDIAALPVGARVTWRSRISGDVFATRLGPNDWESERGARFTDYVIASGGPTYLAPADAPGDSTGARCPVYAVEPAPYDDDLGNAGPWWDVAPPDAADSDGTPDTLPAVDACAALTA
jgi:hypothetical protein